MITLPQKVIMIHGSRGLHIHLEIYFNNTGIDLKPSAAPQLLSSKH